MNVKSRHRFFSFIICFICLVKSLDAQSTTICPTAYWNNTFRVTAGISGVAASTATTFNGPHDIFFTNNTMYAADYYNNRIQKFVGGSPTATTVPNLTLSNPSSIFVDSTGALFILDTSNYRVLKWMNSIVTVVAGGRGAGSALNQITTSYSIVVDSSSNIYVSEYGNHRVTFWTAANPNTSQVVAGGNGAGSTSDKLNSPFGIYLDNSGTLYIADSSNHRIQQWFSGAVIGTTVAGQSGVAGSWSYQFNFPVYLTGDQFGYLYVMDANNDRVQKWFPGASYGVTVAVSTSMSNPRGMRFDLGGNIVIADHSMHRVVLFGLVCPPNASTTVAPTPQPYTPVCQTAEWNQTVKVAAGSTGTLGSTPTLLYYPHNIYIDVYGNMFVADCDNHRIQRFPRGSMIGTTVAGVTSSPGSSYSQLYYPTSVVADPNGAMYILDWTNCRVMKWQLGEPLGFVVAGGHGCGGSLTQIDNSYGLFVDNQSNIYISEYRNHRVVQWLPTNTTSGILVAGGNGLGSTADKLNYPWGVFVDQNQDIYVVDRGNHRVQLWPAGSNIGSTVAGRTSDPGPWSYQLSNPTSLTLDAYGYIYIMDNGNNRVQKWWPGAAYGATVVSASMSNPYGLQIDRTGKIIIADTANHRVISFSMTCPASTTTTTLPPTTPSVSLCTTATWNSTYTIRAGLTSTIGSTNILLNYPYNVYYDGYQSLYVVDTANHRIQLFPSGSYFGTTVAGVTGSSGGGYSQLSSPSAIYVDANRAMYILDTGNYRVLRWQVGEPLGYVVAGGRSWGASLTQISTSYGMFVDNQFNIFVSDSGNSRVTKWLATNTTAGILVAGGNGAGSTADKLNNPWGIYVTANETIFIADRNNHRIQRWDMGVINGITVAGTTSSAGPWSYQFNNPTAVIVDTVGFLFVLDAGNGRIQKWQPGAFYGSTVFSSSMATPCGMQLDRLNNLVVADTNNHRILSFGLQCLPTTTTTPTPITLTTARVCQTAIWNQAFTLLAGTTGSQGSSPILLSNPADVGYDGYYNMYVVDTSNHRIQQFAPGSSTGVTIAGTGSAGGGFSELNNPSVMHIDNSRTLYILDTGNYRVLRWALGDPLGYVVAGGRSWGSSLTQITTSYGMYVDTQSNVYVSEYGNHRISKWLPTNLTSGILVAGGNGAGSTLDRLNNPWGIYVDVNETIFIVDTSNHRVQRWVAGALSGTTVAGSSADPGPYAYQFNTPTSLVFDQFGFMYVLDSGNSRVQRWIPGATYGITVAASPMNSPDGLRFGPRGDIIVADTSNQRILSFAISCPATTTTTSAPPTTAVTQVCATAIWNQTFNTLSGSMANAGSTSTLLNNPSDIGYDPYQNMYIVDTDNHRIQRIPSGSNIATTVAGVTGISGNRRSELSYPYAIHVTTNQTMFICDTNNYRVLRWQVGEPLGYIVAGGQGSGSGFNQIGTSYAMFVDNQYNVYVSDSGNHRVTIWRASNTTSGQLVAGGNGAGNTADKLNAPWGIYVTSTNDVYIVDRNNHRVQRWDANTVVGVTVAGSTSDPGPWSYQFSSPTAITIDQFGYIYILDYNNDRVQKWWPSASFGVTVASTTLVNPRGMRFDRQSNIVIADTGYHRIISFGLLCPPSTTTTNPPPTQAIVPLCPTAIWNQTLVNLAGALSTIGSTSTLFAYPYDIGFDEYRNMYVVDSNNHRIQRFPSGSNLGVTVAGFSLGSGASRSELYYPSAIHVTPNGTMFILDNYNFRVLKWQVGDQLGYIIAGGRGQGSSYDKMSYSYGIFVDDRYNVYLSEQANHRVMLWYVTNTTMGQLVAGGNGAGNTPDKLNSPWGVYVDVNGTIFVVDRANHRVQKWLASAASGTTVAGSTSDPGPWAYQFNNPTAITLDQYGFIYILDFSNSRVQKWLPGASYGATVITAQLSSPTGMRIDRLSNMVIADTNNHRVISFGVLCPAPTTTTTAPPLSTTAPLCTTAQWNQTVAVIAGATSNPGSTSTLLNNPFDINFDGYQNMYVVDHSNHRIQQYARGIMTATTVAGFSLGSGTSRAELNYPVAIEVTPNGTMYILDRDNYRILKWQLGDQLGYIVVGGRGAGSAFTQIGTSYGLFLDPNYNIYVSENTNHRVTFWTAGNTTAGRLAAGGNGAGNTPDKLNGPWGIYVNTLGQMYIVDRSNHRVQRWAAGASFGDTVAGSTSDPGPWSYQFNNPTAITLDRFGYIYVLDFGNDRVQKWWPSAAYGTTAASAAMGNAYGLRIDPYGNFLVADTSNHCILRFGLQCPPTTTTTTAPPTLSMTPICPTATWNQSLAIVAGATSNPGTTGTLLNAPYDVTFDPYGNMYVADFNNHRIQLFPYGSFIGTTIAGFSLGSGASRSELYYPSAIAVTPNRTMFIVDDYNFRVLKWQVGEPLGYIVAGGRGLGSTFDRIGYSAGIFVDAQYNVYVSENSNHRVTLWSAGNTTAGRLIAGGNGAGNTVDKLNGPWGIYIDANGTIYIADRNNHRIQQWRAGINNGMTVAGSTSDPGPWSYQLISPTSVSLDQYGYLYILDQGNSRVQKWLPGASYGTTVVSGVMSSPYGMTFDRGSNLVIADSGYHRVLSFALTCPPSTTTTTAPPTRPSVPLCGTATWNATSNTIAGAISNAGTTSTLLNFPYDVNFDGYQNMYVVDCNNHRIQQYTYGSNNARTVAGVSFASGSGRSELSFPAAVYVDTNSVMYILDSNNYRVLRWQLGEPLGTVIVGGRGSGSTFDKIGRSYAMFIDSQFNIYVSDNANHRVTLWFNGNTTAGTLVVGGNGAGNTADKLNSPWGVYVDNLGTVYVVDRGNHRVQRWGSGAASGTTVAGSTSDPGPWSYQFNNPTAIIFDPYGYLYVLDTSNSRVQKWYPGAPYGVTVISAVMNSPLGMQLDRLGNVAIADTSYHRIISFGVTCPATTTTTALPSTQPIISLCATATWNQSYTVEAGSTGTFATTSTLLYNPYDIKFDAYSNMYVVDTSNHRIQMYPPGSSSATTIAGNSGAAGSSRSELNNPYAIHIDANRTMYILDGNNYRVLLWQVGIPVAYVVAGGRGIGSTFDRIGTSYALFVDAQGNIYVSEYSNNRVTKWAAGNTTASTLIAGGNGVGSTSDKFSGPWGIYLDSTNAMFVVDRNNHRVQKWNSGASAGITVAGLTGVPGPWSYQFNNPTAITFDPFGYMYILDQANNRIQKWLPGATYGTTVISATMSSPTGMVISRTGNFYIADTSYHRILSFSLGCPPTTTIAPSPPTQVPVPLCQTANWNASLVQVAGGLAFAGSTQYLLNSPYDVAIDVYQNVYVADYNNHRIQRFPYGSNIGTTVAGFSLASGSGFSELSFPAAVYVDTNSVMYILDSNNYRVLRWQLGEPLGTVIVGGRGSGSTFDKIGRSYAMFIDSQFNIYVSDNANHRVTLWFNGNTTAGALVAGGNGAGNTADKLNSPWGVYVDNLGTIYIVDRGNHRVQQWTAGAASGTTVAGSTSDPGPWSYQFNSPTAITFDPFGFMFILDSSNSRVQKWRPGGTFGITVLSASLNSPIGMQLDRAGTLFMTDTGAHRIVSFSVWCPPTTTTTPSPPTLTTTLMCTTAVWNSNATVMIGTTGTAGSTATFLSSPSDIAFDRYGNMYVADTSNQRIQQYAPGSNQGATVAGVTGTFGSARALLYNPYAIDIDSAGAMYILDTTNYRVLKWIVGDTFGTVVVNGRGAGSTLDKIGVSYAMCLDNSNNIFVSECGNHRVTKWISGNNTISQLVAGITVAGSTADRLNCPRGVHVDANNVLYVVDQSNHRVQKWPAGAAVGTTVAGETGVAGSWSYQLNSPTGIVFDQYGYMYILDVGNSRIQRWLPGMTYGITVAAPSFSSPIGINFDYAANIIVADTNNHRIASFNIFCSNPTTVTAPRPTLPPNLACQTGIYSPTWLVAAGTSPTAGSTSTFLSSPMDVYVDGYQNIYVADYANSRIQKFPPAGTTIGAPIGNTVAGYSLAGGSGYSQLTNPTAVFLSSNGTMYIADYANYRVQKWLPNEPLGFTVAGGRGNGATYDRIGVVYAIFVDGQENVYVSENSNHRITLWFAGNTTAGRLVAGLGSAGTALNQLNSPWGVHVTLNGTIYVSDRGNHRIVIWTNGATSGVIVAGITASAGAGATQLNLPTAIAVDNFNNLYVMDAGNNRVQQFVAGITTGVTIISMGFNSPRGMRLDSISNIYIADMNNHRIILFKCEYNVTTTTITTSTSTTQTTSTSTTTTTVTTTTTTTATIITTTTTTGITSATTSAASTTTPVGGTTTIAGTTTTTIPTTAGLTTTTVVGMTTTTGIGVTTTITTGVSVTTTISGVGSTTTGVGVTTTIAGVGSTTTGVGITTGTTVVGGITTTISGITTTGMGGITTTGVGGTTTVPIGTTTTAVTVTTTAGSGGGSGGSSGGGSSGGSGGTIVVQASGVSGSGSSEASLDAGTIAAITIGAVAGVAGLFAGGFYFGKKFDWGIKGSNSGSGSGSTRPSPAGQNFSRVSNFQSPNPSSNPPNPSSRPPPNPTQSANASNSASKSGPPTQSSSNNGNGASSSSQTTTETRQYNIHVIK